MKIMIVTPPMSKSTFDKMMAKKLDSSGGWIQMLIENIQKYDIIEKADIVAIAGNNDNSVIKLDKVNFHFIKAKEMSLKPNSALQLSFQKIIDDANPDIIDIQGIEFPSGMDLLRCKRNCPVIATLQGLPAEIATAFDVAMPKGHKLKYRTIYDWTHFKGTFETWLLMKKRGEISHEILKNVDYVMGRTEWDHANTWKVNNKLKYYYNARVLRDDFYENKWNINDINRHVIFGMQGRSSAKGIHVGIEALNILKKEYPDVKLIVPGAFKFDSPKNRMRGYEKYVRKLIKDYSLENNIEFVGALTAGEMAEYMKKSNVFCQYSLMENSPNSLAEAMVMGVPCVASYVGGTSTYITPEVNALAYQRDESGTLAFMIKRIFDDDELALKLSENASRDAGERFNKNINSNTLFEIYKDIVDNQK